MSAAPDVYVGPAYLGWRSWRILPMERLGREATVRLAASGTRGNPKFWQPGEATVATCGKFKTTHESPWPGCECGLYAYRSREHAWKHLQTFLEGDNGDGALGWAFGRVSLWGRIVECEDGWRAQYAYPYAIEVYAAREVAAAVRGVYGVDVEPREPFPEQKSGEEPEQSTAARLEEIGQELQKLREMSARPALDGWRERWERSREEMRRHLESLGPLPHPLNVTADEALVAVLAAIGRDLEDPFRPEPCRDRARLAPAVECGDVTAVLLELRGEPGEPFPEAIGYGGRDGVERARREVSRALDDLTSGGILDCGHHQGVSAKRWRITAAGRRRLREAGWPRTVTLHASAASNRRWMNRDAELGEVLELREAAVSLARGFRALSYPPQPFEEEIAAATDRWRTERRAAQKQGRRAYRRWLDERRAECKRIGLASWRRYAFTDDEVMAALRSVSRGRPVPFQRIRERLMPGSVVASESAGLSQALVRLRQQGLAAGKAEWASRALT